jgi:hypothetical protein
MAKKIKELETLATELVGDGKTPNMFFVSGHDGVCILITPQFDIAYYQWESLPRDKERTLEDRKTGVICHTARHEDSGRMITTDDSIQFGYRKVRVRTRY